MLEFSAKKEKMSRIYLNDFWKVSDRLQLWQLDLRTCVVLKELLFVSVRNS